MEILKKNEIKINNDINVQDEIKHKNIENDIINLKNTKKLKKKKKNLIKGFQICKQK